MKKRSIILALMLLSTTLTYAQWHKSRIKGEGPVVEQEFDLPEFTELGLGISAKVYLNRGTQHRMVIKAQQNIIDNLSREVNGKELNLEFDKTVKGHAPITIYLTLDAVEKLAIGGSGSIIGKERFDGMEAVEISIGGSGDVRLAGSARSLEINIAGSGDVETSELETAECAVNIAGSGDARVHVNGPLNVSIAGSGDVKYKGKPNVRSSVVGSGSVRTMN